jgi:hypothetical protein
MIVTVCVTDLLTSMRIAAHADHGLHDSRVAGSRSGAT